MAYVFTQAANNQAIAECEWGKASEIMFTGFSSCIGIMAIKDNEVIGVHLPLRDASNAVTDADIDTAIGLLDGGTSPVVIGSISAWKASASSVYQHLVDTLKPVDQFSYGDGTYGGEIKNGKIQPRYQLN
ncbi:hypothetical protein [Thalassospira lucentensis]|uniref:hypothetical protein n=1 Tax=Thalassospira lucentensis TaxID=168935 RepID=UPI00142DD598|nr:hypothetical protein [Thalassospira lucentensis]NIZ03111.1 hypothetical protein [Thalassospira lucentensis]